MLNGEAIAERHRKNVADMIGPISDMTCMLDHGRSVNARSANAVMLTNNIPVAMSVHGTVTSIREAFDNKLADIGRLDAHDPGVAPAYRPFTADGPYIASSAAARCIATLSCSIRSRSAPAR